MAATIRRQSIRCFQRALHYSSHRQICVLNSTNAIIRSHVPLWKSFRLSSHAPKDEPEAEPTKDAEVTAKEKELLQENQKLLEDVQNLNDKYKRALADNENIRARMRREIGDAKLYGIQGFVRDLAEVADVLARATESVPPEALTQGDPHLKGLFEGLRMTEGQLMAVFRRHGVSRINPLGEKFDPNCHEALFEQEDPSREPGTVGTVTKVGYRLHERTVRPAMVGVVKARRPS